MAHRAEDEVTLRQAGMRDDQSSRSKGAPAPRDHVKVKDARAPSFARAAPELALDRLYRRKHCFGVPTGFDQHDSIGEFAASSAHRRINDDWRCRE
jgi:hypothetical protein